MFYGLGFFFLPLNCWTLPWCQSFQTLSFIISDKAGEQGGGRQQPFKTSSTSARTYRLFLENSKRGKWCLQYLSLCLKTSFTFIKIYFWNNSRRSCTIQQWKLNSLAPNTVSIWPFGIFTLLGIFFLVWMLHIFIFIATTQLQRSVWWFLYLFICFFCFNLANVVFTFTRICFCHLPFVKCFASLFGVEPTPAVFTGM